MKLRLILFVIAITFIGASSYKWSAPKIKKNSQKGMSKNIPFLIYPVRFYTKYLSPQNGATCRFRPSCSVYSRIAVQRFGILKGLLLTFERLERSHIPDYDMYKTILKRGVIYELDPPMWIGSKKNRKYGHIYRKYKMSEK